MKKKVAFQKEIEFPTMIGEISAISLEHNLKFIDESSVEGDLLLTGKYKLTEASRLEEDFSYKIPTEIALTEKLDLETSKIEITDFTYEIENEDTMICKIELLIDGVEVVDLEEETLEENENNQEMVRECDGDSKETKEIELPKIEKEEKTQTIEDKREEEIEEKMEQKMEQKKEEIIVNESVEKEEVHEKVEVKKEVDSLFASLAEEKETYGTFLVYIVRQNESINSIIEKYNTSVEEIEKYNDLNDLNIGTKLIIPIIDA